MADSQGIDLADLVMQAEFSMDDMEEAVEKCIGCANPTACACLMETQTETLSLPEYCRNGDMFGMLKQA
jgi:hypothetical protein